MISPAKVETNSAKASQYFREHFSSGDYYEQEGKSPGTWFGKGAESLGLKGEVTLEEFCKLADNRHPATGEHLTQRRNELRNSGTEANRRCYQDFSISPPKSVSIQAIAMGDTRIVEAHNRAVREAAKVLEGAASARVRSASDPLNGKDRLTGNICAAVFQHDTSRAAGEGLAPDPQLHSHLIIFNATQDPGDSNKWKALQNYNILRAQKLANSVYDHSLTQELHAMGYKTREKAKGWELDHISDEMVERFSKRNRAINAKSDELEAAGSKTKREELNSKVAHDDRMRKQPHITTAMLRKSWTGQMGVQELEKCQIPTPITHNNNHPIVSRIEPSAKGALDWAKLHLFERNAVVREGDILATALQHVRGSSVSLESIQTELLNDSELLREINGDRMTTREAFGMEMEIINSVKSGKGKYMPLAPGLLESAGSLSDLQRNAAVQILASRDFLTNFRGGAGTGKSFTLKHVSNALESSGKNVLVLAPQNQQVNGLVEDGFENVMTVSSFIAPSADVALDENSVVIVDEAGQLAGKDMQTLLNKVSRAGGRVVLSGDTRQHGAVAASDALIAIERYAQPHSAELIGHGAIQRQKVEEYKQAVAMAEAGDSASSFHALDKMGAVRQVSAKTRQSDVAALYLEKLETGTALVVSQTNLECDALNESIRNAMISAGQLDPATAIKRQTLKGVDLTNAQKQLASSYPEGTVILLNRKVGECKAGTECQFVRAGNDGSIVISAAGKNVTVKKTDLEKLTVLEPKEIELAIGDRIQLKANVRIGPKGKEVKLANGSILQFIGTNAKGQLIVEDRHEKKFALPQEFRQFRHGYAVTSYSSQGKTVDHVIISDSQSKGATSKKEWYVSISRGRQSCSILTADKEQLAENIEKLGDRELASELVLDHAPKPKNPELAELSKRGVGAKIKSALSALPEYWEHFISRAGEWFVRGLGAGRELERTLGIERDRAAERELRDTGRDR